MMQGQRNIKIRHGVGVSRN